MDIRYWIGILCALVVAVGAIAGTTGKADESADLNEITQTISVDEVAEKLSEKGFDVGFDGDTITAYGERGGWKMTLAIDCPGGECTKPGPPEGGCPMGTDGEENCTMGKGPGGMMHGMRKHFRFRMGGGPKGPEALRPKLEAMNLGPENIEIIQARLAEMGYKQCPWRTVAEEASG